MFEGFSHFLMVLVDHEEDIIEQRSDKRYKNVPGGQEVPQSI